MFEEHSNVPKHGAKKVNEIEMVAPTGFDAFDRHRDPVRRRAARRCLGHRSRDLGVRAFLVLRAALYETA